MHALVIYESMYGDTKRVAEAVAAGLAERMTAEAVEVAAAPFAIESDVDLLVIGGPTHIHGMTTGFSRSQAAQQVKTPLVSQGSGIREWLEQLRATAPAVPAATFDTRLKGAALLTGSAAGGFARRLRDAGFPLLAPAESFLVGGKAEPGHALLEGELERAKAWGAALAAKLGARSAIPVG